MSDTAENGSVSPIAQDLFAGIPVTDYGRSLTWYRLFLGAEPSFFPNDIEAVWEVGEHRYLYIEQVPDRSGGSMHMLMVEDLDAVVAAAAERGHDPARVERYDEGMRKVVYRDPDGNEISYGGVTAGKI
ncbi:VOC family protein [Actinopolymorpha alba]|uniref:VOC family protein n=1 Tax=Actinopolymorpha alba TaxID=533267 RepID=UPI0003801FF2|nr:VOC family protein [Actinopolymorpha alba]